MEDESYYKNLLLVQYVDNFNIHFRLLLRRYKRFKEIDTINNTDIDVITYLDMIVVQLRAMCIENDRYKNNYTVQILLKKLGKEELATRIDEMLDQQFRSGWEDFSIRKSIKTLADQFICHYDNFDGENLHELSSADIIVNQLRNPHEQKNLDYIMKELINCVGERLTIEM